MNGNSERKYTEDEVEEMEMIGFLLEKYVDGAMYKYPDTISFPLSVIYEIGKRETLDFQK